MAIVKGTPEGVQELPSASETRAAQEVFEELTEAKENGAAVQVLRRLQTPPGMKWVFNRLPQDFEKFFDGIPYRFGAHSQMVLPEHIADFLYRTSVVKYEPETGEAVRALVTVEDESFGIPYVAELGPELLSREVNDNYIQRGTGGVPTKAKIVPVRGGGYDSGRPVSQVSRLG